MTGTALTASALTGTALTDIRTTTLRRTTRLLAAAADTAGDHEAAVGPLPGIGAADLLAMVEAAGLTGRGGAGFPTARKLAAVAAGGRPVVVGNGAEGEPASSKDRVLLTVAPHLVLDGLALAARAVGAGRAYLYAPQDLLESTVRAAADQRRDDVRVQLVAAPDTFIAGQETAVVAAINGGRAIPTIAPPAVFQRGVSGRPTLVQNVETLAQLALLARYGPRWFREVGTADEPGTRLTTVSGAVCDPGVQEVAGGTALSEIVAAAGGFSEPVQALLVGGYHGGWVPCTSATAGLPLTRAALAPWDAAPGAGIVIALPARSCGVQAGAAIAAYLAGQNAGQCGPCRNGLPTLAEHLTDLAQGRGTVDTVAELHRVTGLVEGRGACHHPGGTVRLVRSTLRAFADDVDQHLAGRCVIGAALDGWPGAGASAAGRGSG
jgi:NADH:ubiquinone oxidoreductase subunit F (NADH-binding)